MARKRLKQRKLYEFPVVSPEKGITQIKNLASTIPPAPKYTGDHRFEHYDSITQLHVNLPSDLGHDELEILHERLTQPDPVDAPATNVSAAQQSSQVVPESPPSTPPRTTSCMDMQPQRASPKPIIYHPPSEAATSQGHVSDSEGENFPCSHSQ